MAPATLFAMAFFGTVVVGTTYCALQAGRLPLILRLGAIITLTPLNFFFIFGFLASGEPGVSPLWKVGYGVLFITSILAVIRLATARRRVEQ